MGVLSNAQNAVTGGPPPAQDWLVLAFTMAMLTLGIFVARGYR